MAQGSCPHRSSSSCQTGFGTIPTQDSRSPCGCFAAAGEKSAVRGRENDRRLPVLFGRRSISSGTHSRGAEGGGDHQGEQRGPPEGKHIRDRHHRPPGWGGNLGACLRVSCNGKPTPKCPCVCTPCTCSFLTRVTQSFSGLAWACGKLGRRFRGGCRTRTLLSSRPLPSGSQQAGTWHRGWRFPRGQQGRASHPHSYLPALLAWKRQGQGPRLGSLCRVVPRAPPHTLSLPAGHLGWNSEQRPGHRSLHGLLQIRSEVNGCREVNPPPAHTRPSSGTLEVESASWRSLSAICPLPVSCHL